MQRTEDNEITEMLVYHEAGHAAVAWRLQVSLGTIRIGYEGGFARDKLRCRERNPEFMSEKDCDCVKKEAQILLGGKAAECALRIERDQEPDEEPYCDLDDQSKLAELCSQLFEGDDRKAAEWLTQASECVEGLVNDNWMKIRALADSLIRLRELSGEDATRILLDN